MNYDNVKIWDRRGDLMLQKGEAFADNGIMEVKGKMEQGKAFKVGGKYRCEGDPNLSCALIYMGQVGSKFRFKID